MQANIDMRQSMLATFHMFVFEFILIIQIKSPEVAEYIEHAEFSVLKAHESSTKSSTICCVDGS